MSFAAKGKKKKKKAADSDNNKHPTPPYKNYLKKSHYGPLTLPCTVTRIASKLFCNSTEPVTPIASKLIKKIIKTLIIEITA